MTHKRYWWLFCRLEWLFLRNSRWVWIISKGLLLLCFSVFYFTLKIICLIFESEGTSSLWSQGTHEDSTVYLFTEIAFEYSSICELKHPVSFIDECHRVKASICFKCVVSRITVSIVGTEKEEVTDRRMMWDLFTVNLCTVRVVSL